MQSELISDAYIYRRPFPHFGRPKVIGYIGLENLKFAKNISNKKVQFDLNLHIDKAVHKPQDLDVKLNELLLFLMKHEARLAFPLQSRLKDAKFFCYRGLMTCVACTPYENREPWKIVVILYKGNIYLCARDTEESLQRKQNMTEKDKCFTSWGYKFEQFILSGEYQLMSRMSPQGQLLSFVQTKLLINHFMCPAILRVLFHDIIR